MSSLIEAALGLTFMAVEGVALAGYYTVRGLVGLGSLTARGVRNGIDAIGRSIETHKEERNKRIQEERDIQIKNGLRIDKNMDEMWLQTMNEINESNTNAIKLADVRISQLKAENEQRHNQMQQAMDTRLSGLRTETYQQLNIMRKQQNDALKHLENQVYDDMSRMQEGLDNRISNLADTVQGIADNVNERIDILASDMQAMEHGLNQRIDAVNRNVGAVANGLNRLTSYVNEMEQRIDRRFDQQQQALQDVRNRVGAIEQRMADNDRMGIERRRIALVWWEELQRMEPDRFVRDENVIMRAADVQREIDALRRMNDNDIALSAAAHQAIVSVQNIEVAYTKERLKYEQKLELTRTMFDALMQTVHQLRVIKLTNDEGKACEVETDFWSRGAYGELQEHLKELQAKLDNHPDANQVDEIQREIAQDEAALHDIRTNALLRVNLSQARMQAIADIIGTMEDRQWEVVEKGGEESIGYMGSDNHDEDQREGAFVVMRNSVGEEVTILVEADEERGGVRLTKNITGNVERTDQENMRLSNDIDQCVEEAGYSVGESRCVSHNHIPEMETAEDLRRKGAKTIMREQRKAKVND